VYETIERRATTLVLAAGIVVPLVGTSGGFGFDETNAAAYLMMAALGLLAVAVVLAVVALYPDRRADRSMQKAQLVFWAHAAFAGGILVAAANVAYLTYRILNSDTLQF
jgi:uncharacterized membrane protein SirB2